MEANSKSGGRNAWISDTIRSRRVQLKYVDGGNKDFAPYFFVEVIEFDLFIYIYIYIYIRIPKSISNARRRARLVAMRTLQAH